jgi:hypothetical protein
LKTSDEEIKKISLENPTEVFVCEDTGRFAFNGLIFNSEDELKNAIKVQMKAVKFLTGNRFFRFLFGIKKNKHSL